MNSTVFSTGTREIRMANPNNRLLGACALALLLAAPVSAETPSAPAPGAPSPTKPALACIFGFGPIGCETMFAAAASRLSGGVIRRNGSGFRPNYFDAKVVWHNDTGDDVWDVKFGE